ncbi:reverse transcriptase [Gossypium australe]|uniref:Reverse transcriptase n=1 Tax=Gossypium australe TaxID=47621 RepID=A0A5B6VJ84_9ROSI|nr:reverse transcriptase [Gossypium australe]
MATMVVVKHLGRNIGYTTLQNKIYNRWWSSMPFKLMDVEHGIVYPKVMGCIRIVFNRSAVDAPDFNPLYPFRNVVMTWIRFLGLLGFCIREILEEIGSLISKVAKLYYNIDSRSRGRFARIAVYVNLDKPLIP